MLKILSFNFNYCSQPKIVLEETKYEINERTLRRMRSKKFPTCTTISRLDELLKHNTMIKNTFGKVRGEKFYEKTVSSGQSQATIFVLSQIANEAYADCDIFIDGTFGILPLSYYQLVIIMAEVQDEVCRLDDILELSMTKN